ncbi:EamA family transporter [Mesorhizobium opportunistum]|uniref:EamA domain-containing protein n=1 Tax=Mesorhizobium opportunistum (strain LMG 24607 / HAMBI 3007 / WSM2075) TaxID=536019 RepID=F7Y0U4_MESOW|nr:EamA family transporter [Mesorhizobium opportunistum]AEH87075.1 protein of unknown function DUF6 transmembrane [Mesorhizobium opportunistum WSM2075]
MFNVNYVLISSSVLVIALGQIIFKFAARNFKTGGDGDWWGIVQQNVTPIALIFLALFLYLLSTVAWVQALRTIPLSVAFMFNALAFIIVPCAGFFLFGESIPKYFYLGMPLILLGIFFISRT